MSQKYYHLRRESLHKFYATFCIASLTLLVTNAMNHSLKMSFCFIDTIKKAVSVSLCCYKTEVCVVPYSRDVIMDFCDSPLKHQSRLQQTTFINIFFLFFCFSEKIRLDVSSESSAWQRIHMKNQAFFFFER